MKMGSDSRGKLNTREYEQEPWVVRRRSCGGKRKRIRKRREKSFLAEIFCGSQTPNRKTSID